jgi:predicted nucleic acid-binding protein
MIVLDASVVLKWIFEDEEGSSGAKSYRERHASGKDIAAVHDLFFYEISNVLTAKTGLNTKDAMELFTLLWHFDFEVFHFGYKEFSAAMELSRRHSISLYDASYIVLAMRLKCDFVTADKKLYDKTKALNAIKLLS